MYSNRSVIFFSWGKEGARESQAVRERWLPQLFSNRPAIFFSWGKEGARESQTVRERWLPQLHPDEKGQLSQGHEVISSHVAASGDKYQDERQTTAKELQVISI